MKLITARVTNYKSIEDSTAVEIDPAVTDLVGKNESGKTAFLEAIERLNPVDPDRGNFDPVYQYPAARYTSYKGKHSTDPEAVVEAVFELEDDDVKAVEDAVGADVLLSSTVTLTKYYDNHTERGFESSTPNDDATGEADLDDAGAEDAEDVEEDEDDEIDLDEAVIQVLEARLPRFLYFGDYQTMPGRISLNDLARRLEEDIPVEAEEEPFLALVEIIQSSVGELRDEVHAERLQRELEGASNHITDEMFKFWQQNQDLQVRFERKEANPDDPAPLNSGRVLEIRVYNPTHRVTVPFDQRSKGFRWFFSFLAYFQVMVEARDDDRRTILLLDEPGLSLHGLAQQDFLRFIDERLAPKHQVIFTTHSPFMIDPSNLSRVRTVFDSPGKGTVISDSVFETDRDTVFPLQAALGYSVAQTLFVGENNLLVEGPSDLVYLDLLSAATSEAGGPALDERWIRVPVGGADKLYSFVSLFGANKLNTIALVDFSAKDAQRVENLKRNGLLAKNGVFAVSDYVRGKEADIEDLFDPAFYLELVSGAYAPALDAPIRLEDLPKGSPRIIRRVEAFFETNDINGGTFSHYRPAAFFSREQNTYLPKVDSATRDRAAKLFVDLNAVLQ